MTVQKVTLFDRLDFSRKKESKTENINTNVEYHEEVKINLSFYES